MMKILIPKEDGIFKIAADAFQDLWLSLTGGRLPITIRDDGDSDLIVMGSDAVSSYTHEKIIQGVIPPLTLATGTDGYQIISARENKRNLLFIAGARPRALLYAVYRFFELRGNCRYFWDGDIRPCGQEISIRDMNLKEEPRFQYRGLRYFAHRSLNRFQAEHWDFDEWKHEIDWILKKRMNFFMLRIGLDDLFQKAFPDIVHYPEGYELPESIKGSASGYNNRDLFWNLQYRGILRQKVLAYARERDLIHPEDIGTMTHWYSRTPLEYLDKVKPDFIPQANKNYAERTGLVWDIRKDENLDAYWKLTQAHIDHYGSPEIFHTIGLAERQCYDNQAANQQMKHYTYHRIIAKLREHYPNAPLLIGSWDFNMFWTPEDVKKLLRELDPQRTLIFDYTSDTNDELNNFKNWGVMGNFPWIFGIFHAYEPSTEPRGNYAQIQRRLPEAAADPMCKGLVLWPECSHTDTLMLDYLAENSWEPTQTSIADFIKGFCQRRYPQDTVAMTSLWELALPLIEAFGWPGCQYPFTLWGTFSDLLFNVPLEDFTPEGLASCTRLKNHLISPLSHAPDLFRQLSRRSSKQHNTFVHRDMIDLGRTAVSRLQNFAFATVMLAQEAWRNGKCPPDRLLILMKALLDSAKLEAQMLAADRDYSLYYSLQLLERKQTTNPNFEAVLKENINNSYCRTYASELFTASYLPKLKLYETWISQKLAANDYSPWKVPQKLREEQKDIDRRFADTPLKDLAPDFQLACNQLSQTFEQLADCAKTLLHQGDANDQNQ